MMDFENTIVNRIKTLTGHLISFKEDDCNPNNTIISFDKIEFILTVGYRVKYFRTLIFHDIDTVAEFSAFLIKKFNLKKIIK